MNYIQQIIEYFITHDFSSFMIQRIQKRIFLGRNNKEEQNLLYDIWIKTEEFGIVENEKKEVYSKISHLLRLNSRKDNIVKKRIEWKRITKIAAVWISLLFLGSTSFYFFYQSSALKETIAQTKFEEHYVPPGKRQFITLSDGSKVWVNAGSFLISPNIFGGEQREVLLIGEAYFDISKDSKRPFIVRVNQLQIKVIGTKFNVSAYPDQENITTTLENGKVEVCIPKREKPYKLTPDEQLIYNKKSDQIQVIKVKASTYADWRKGGLLFKQTSFREVVATLERTYNIKIHFKNSSYLDDKLTIHFNQNESLETIMMLLREMTPAMNYHIHGNMVILF